MEGLIDVSVRWVIRVVAAAALMAPIVSAQAQDFMERSHKQQGPQPEVKPKVDEKAYKAALEKIPVPDKKYDPWGVARPSDQTKTVKKSNQAASDSVAGASKSLQPR